MNNYIGKCQACDDKDVELNQVFIKGYSFLFCEDCTIGQDGLPEEQTERWFERWGKKQLTGLDKPNKV